MKKFWIIAFVALSIFIFGLISKGGFGQPPCPNPLIFKTPVDMNKVTSILYPGQERSGYFKPHGGFRFDNAKPDEIEVVTPLDSILQDVQGYREDGEIQYLFDFVNPCGIVYRFDHLATLAPKFAKLVESLPIIDEKEWKEGKGVHQSNLRKQNITVKQGEVVATAVGFRKTNNVFVDFGVYDLRGKNMFQNPRPYAICWFDLLSPQDAAKVKNLPAADSINGKKSAYCK